METTTESNVLSVNDDTLMEFHDEAEKDIEVI